MKKIKWLIIVVIIIYTGVVAMDIFNNKPFRFEDFKTGEELQSFLKSKFPRGSDINKIEIMLTDSGAKCEVVSHKEGVPNELKKYDYVVWCEYSTGWISLHPLEHYKVIMLGDKSKQIIAIWTERTTGIVI